MTEPAMRPELTRLRYIDSLRGFAALYVVVFHFAYVSGVMDPTSVNPFVDLGGTGVMLFFVISCFSLFLTMPARLKRGRPVTSFYLHRFFRIAPLFYMWLVIQTYIEVVLYDREISVWYFLQNVFFVFNLVPEGQTGIVLASWTIGVEMMFYAIFPLVYFTTKNLRAALVATAGSMVLFLAMNAIVGWIDTPTATNIGTWLFVKDLPVFALGAVCYFVIQGRYLASGRIWIDRAQGGALLTAGVLVLTAFALKWVTNDIFGGNPYIWPGIGYSLTVIGLSLWPISLFVNAVSAFFGKISYSVYLAHVPIIILLSTSGVYSRLTASAGGTSKATVILCLVTTYLLVIPFATLTYKFVEEPFIRGGRRVISRVDGGAATVRVSELPAPESVRFSECR